MIQANRYVGLMNLYTEIQNTKYQHIDLVKTINSRLHEGGLQLDFKSINFTGVYSCNGNTITIPDREIANAIVDAVNWVNGGCCAGWSGPDGAYEKFVASLPAVTPDRATELHAVNNHITIESGKYYSAPDIHGKIHVFAGGNGLDVLETDRIAGRVSGDSKDTARFWSIMASGGPDCCNKVPNDKLAKYLDMAGVEPGFFTVETPNRKWEYYFSPEPQSYVERKSVYDDQWDMLHSASWRMTPGDLIRSRDGREFLVDASGIIDVEYGEELSEIIDGCEVIGHVDM